MGAVATDHSATTPYAERLSQTEAEGIVARALSGDSGSEDAARFTANVLVEMAGMSVYPAQLLGAPWWFFDSPLGMRRYLDAVMETAGLYNTAGFNDDTRAFASIPSRHNVWRRITCDWLAGMVSIGVVDEEEAPDMAREFAYGLAKRAYGFQKEPVGRT
jgi:glucuronate isomerase